MKYLFYAILILIGFVLGSSFNKGIVEERKVVKYKTVYKEKPETLSCKELLHYAKSPIVIDHTIKNNWVKITAHDDLKESRKDILTVCKTDNWKVVAGVSAACILTGGVLKIAGAL